MADDASREPKRQSQAYIDLYRDDPDNPAELTPGLIDYMIHTVGPNFSAFHAQCRTAYRYYQMDFETDVPKGTREILLPTFRARLQTMQAQVSAGYVDIMVPPRRITSGGTAEKMEKFLDRARLMMERQTPTDETMLLHMALYGVAFKKLAFDYEKLYKLPEVDPEAQGPIARAYTKQVDEILERQSWTFPIVAKTLEPTEMIWDVNSHQPKWMIWKSRRPMSIIQAIFPEWDKDENAGEEYLDFYEIWTKDRVAFWCDDRYAMRPRKHDYGMIPILMATPSLPCSSNAGVKDASCTHISVCATAARVLPQRLPAMSILVSASLTRNSICVGCGLKFLPGIWIPTFLIIIYLLASGNRRDILYPLTIKDATLFLSVSHHIRQYLASLTLGISLADSVVADTLNL